MASAPCSSSSGQAAETVAILNVAEAGDHVVASPSLYGGTYNLLKYTLKKLGVETTFVEDPDDLDSWRAAVRPNTKLFFAETISNPKQDVLDIEGVAGVAHEVGVPLIVDNTVATPYLIRPLEWGADVVLHSATKYLGGHGTSIGGVIVDGGTFDYTADPARFPNYNEPDPSYHGLVYGRDLGVGSPLGANLSFILKARVQLLRDLGPAISPFNAFLISQGIETLSLRIERHVDNAHKVAEWLQGRDEVRVRGLRVAAVLAVERPGAQVRPARRRRHRRVRDRGRRSRRARSSSRRWSCTAHVANIGDVRSLVIHPASTTHSQLSVEDQAAAGVTPGAGAPGRGHRAHRRHPRRPRAGLHRRQGRLSRTAGARPIDSTADRN